jgi:pectate lyase
MHASLRCASACLLVAVLGAGAQAFAAQSLGRETLPAGDGWAALDSGTTGGAAADADHVFVVTNRQQLIAALNGLDATPKIIYVRGTIDVNVDDDNQTLRCADYERDGYTLEAYLAAYDPAVWGRLVPSGPLEDARIASQKAQQDRVRIKIGSNTTIVGLGKRARIRGAWFDIRNATNIIIRNLTFQDTFDCFPQWDPTDGSLGNWNALYDSISLRTSTHVWIDHNTFEDEETADETLPSYYGRLFQVHDGQTDITNASDLVTVSWNVYRNHDKVMLIGSSDSGSTAKADRGKLNVTIHHNLFQHVNQRAPRVRFGKVHIYDNLYLIKHGWRYSYSWGVGIESMIDAANNFFWMDETQAPDQVIDVFKGTAIHVSGTLVNGLTHRSLVDVLAAYNELNDPDLSGDVGWTPTLFLRVDPAKWAFWSVLTHAGPFHRRFHD